MTRGRREASMGTMLATHWNWTAALAISSLGVGVGVAACGSDSDTTSSSDEGTTAGPGGPSSTASGAGGAGVTSASAGGASGTSSASTGAGRAGCKGLGDACSDCAAMQCNAQYCACYGNPTCGQLVACVQNCPPGDMGCGQNCLTANEAGITDALLLSDCAAGGCMADCPTAAKLTACEVCALQNCPQQMNKCVANPECTALIQCVEGCMGDDFCNAGCAFDHGDGQTDAQAVQDCTKTPCANQCG